MNRPKNVNYLPITLSDLIAAIIVLTIGTIAVGLIVYPTTLFFTSIFSYADGKSMNEIINIVFITTPLMIIRAAIVSYLAIKLYNTAKFFMALYKNRNTKEITTKYINLLGRKYKFSYSKR